MTAFVPSHDALKQACKCIRAGALNGRVISRNRRSAPRLTAPLTIDGKLIMPMVEGRSDFDELQRRNLLQRPRMIDDAAAVRPAVLVVFDPA